MSHRAHSTDKTDKGPIQVDLIGKLPAPRELVRAHRTLRKLTFATMDLNIRDLAGSPAWEGLTEGRRMLAVTTIALGDLIDEAYQEAWERMMND